MKEPLWRQVVGDVLRRERLAQERTLRDVAEEARISLPYLSEVERGRKEASSEVLAAAAHALGLGLVDLLALAQREFERLTGVKAAKARSEFAPVARVGFNPERGAGPGDAGVVRSVAQTGFGGGSRESSRYGGLCLAA